ncbi:hypothetical protein PI126_g11618 [Phytophthora idaei]|nr:hypothetical protein PI126_g11618 [Phytophthora idaei]
MIYQRLIDIALKEYVQPKGGWKSFAQRMIKAEEDSSTRRKELTELGYVQPSRLTKFEADRRTQTQSDPVQMLVNGPDTGMFVGGEPDESSPVFKRRSFVDDICFGGKTFEDCLETLDSC